MKFTSAFALLLCLCLGLLGCQSTASPAATGLSPTTTPAPTEDVVVAQVGDTRITASQVDAQFELYADTYLSDVTSGSAEYDQTALSLKVSLLDTLVDEELVRQQAAAQGVVLSAEEQADLDAQMQTLLENLRTQVLADLGDEAQTASSELLDALVDQELLAAGYTRNTYRDALEQEAVYYKYYQIATADAALSQEALETSYAQLVQQHKQRYLGDGTLESPDPACAENIACIESDYDTSTVAYFPARYVAVTHILIGFTPETQLAIQKVAADTTLTEEQRTQQISTLQAQGYAQIYDRASQAQQRALAGEDFTALIREYGEDSDMTGDALAYGYLIGSDTDFDANFRNSALAATQAGQISGLVKSQFGYHIIRCMNIFQPGEVPLSQVLDRYTTEANRQPKEEAFLAVMQQLREQTGTQVYADRLTA